MMNLATHCKLDPPTVIRIAFEYFGPGGLGPAVLEQSETTVQFEGGAGLARPYPRLRAR
jgi:hypothetical protein